MVMAVMGMTSKSDASIKCLENRPLQNLFVAELSGLLRPCVAAVGKRRAVWQAYVGRLVRSVKKRRAAFAALLVIVRPAWARSWRWKSSRKLATANEVKRNCTRATECGEEAWSETASRWTRTRYEAQPSRASGQRSAKLSWSRLRRRKSGGCAGKDRVLTWGDLASWLKGRRGNAERGVSRGRSSCLRGVKGRTRRKADNHVSWTCSASAAWATGANRKRAG